MTCSIVFTYNMASSDLSVDCGEHGFVGYIGEYDPRQKEQTELAYRMYDDHVEEQNGNTT